MLSERIDLAEDILANNDDITDWFGLAASHAEPSAAKLLLIDRVLISRPPFRYQAKKGGHKIVDYNIFTNPVNIKNKLFRENQH